jgi:hypothetical protein
MHERHRNIQKKPSIGNNKRKTKFSREKKTAAICNRVQLPINLLPRDQIFKVSNTIS